jgi:hypothetical protein
MVVVYLNIGKLPELTDTRIIQKFNGVFNLLEYLLIDSMLLIL